MCAPSLCTKRRPLGCPEADIRVNNNAGPPPGELEDWYRDACIAALESSMLVPILLIRAFLPGMRARRFGRIVNITSAMVHSPPPHMALSTTARTGLTAFSKSVSLDAVAENVTINNLLPERIDTPRQAFMTERMMKAQNIERADAVAAKRFGTPAEFADACAYQCSAQAGFISGQNLQLDGGSYHGLIWLGASQSSMRPPTVAARKSKWPRINGDKSSSRYGT